MSEERRKILNMLAESKISVEEAEQLLEAVGEEIGLKSSADEPKTGRSEKSGSKSKYMYVSVKPKREGEGKKDTVNIKIPLNLLRTGLKLGGVLPESARSRINKVLGEKGVDISQLDSERFEGIIEELSELAIQVDDEEETVSIYCE